MAQQFRAETPSQEMAATGPAGGGQAEHHKATVLRMLDDLINGGKMELAPEYIADNMVNHDTANPVQGLEGFVQFFSTFRAGFPDMRNTIEDIIAEGDKVVMRITVHATHTGTFMGIPPTGRETTVTGIDILRFENGKVVEHWAEFDRLSLMQQLGVIPA